MCTHHTWRCHSLRGLRCCDVPGATPVDGEGHADKNQLHPQQTVPAAAHAGALGDGRARRHRHHRLQGHPEGGQGARRDRRGLLLPGRPRAAPAEPHHLPGDPLRGLGAARARARPPAGPLRGERVGYGVVHGRSFRRGERDEVPQELRPGGGRHAGDEDEEGRHPPARARQPAGEGGRVPQRPLLRRGPGARRDELLQVVRRAGGRVQGRGEVRAAGLRGLVPRGRRGERRGAPEPGRPLRRRARRAGRVRRAPPAVQAGDLRADVEARAGRATGGPDRSRDADKDLGNL
mmetsp:Transcript_27483/g.77745  ORF Transcript_27483/g.77745 Transcript_27483/m.77745 type:complete len:291 (+) Transcript_27483:634-1506(+)